MALHAEDRSLVFVDVDILFVSKEFESVNDAEDTHTNKNPSENLVSNWVSLEGYIFRQLTQTNHLTK